MDWTIENAPALTKRELFAMHALPLAAGDFGLQPGKEVARDILDIVDALLKALEETEPKGEKRDGI